MSIMDPNEYVPGTDDEYAYLNNASPVPQPTLAQVGPQLAADGRFGALMQVAANQHTPVFDDSTMQQMRDRMMQRVRTPDQMDAAISQRRGALENLNREITSPNNDSTFFRDLMMNSSLGRGKGMDWNTATSLAIGQAMAQADKKFLDSKQNRVAAAKNSYDFLGVEDQAADKSENKAMDALSKMASAQVRGQNSAAGRIGKTIYNLPGVGIVDVSQIDPATGRAKVLASSDESSKLYAQFHKQYMGMTDELIKSGILKSPAEVNQWVHEQTLGAMNNALAQKSTPASVNPVATPKNATPPYVPDGDIIDSAVRKMESSGNMHAVSPVGAKSDMQVMDATNQNPGYGVKPGDGSLEDRSRVGSDYLKAMIAKYGPVHGLIAYNWGPGNTDKWLEAGGDMRKLPTETRLYVGDVLGTAQGLSKQTSVDPGNSSSPASVTTQPAQQPLGTGNQFITPDQQKAKNENAEGMEREINKVYEGWNNARQKAGDMRTSLSAIRAMRPTFETGITTPLREKLGAALQGVGITNELTKEATNLQTVNKLIRNQVNERISMEKGVQTRDDEARIRDAFVKTGDTPAAFDLSMDLFDEFAARNQMRGEFGERWKSTHGTGVGMQKGWEDELKSRIGPSVATVGGMPMTRTKFIEQSVEATLRKYPNANPSAVRQKAEEAWLGVNK